MKKTIGVLGGMGPEATVSFFQQLVALTPAEKDQDHFKVVIVNDPQIPDRGAFLEGQGDNPLPAMIQAARDLERLGVSFIAMPCNTAHAFWPELRQAVAIPVLNIVQETVAEIARQLVPANGHKVAVMGTRATVRLGIYQNALSEQGISALEPDKESQQKISSVIDCLKGPRDYAQAARWLAEAIDYFEKQGATGLIYGCTELGLAKIGNRLPVFDSTRILAAAAVKYALG